jgi:translation initiation factor 2 gamma subunit (eIF-2gamma)
VAEGAPIIPISAQLKYNIEVVRCVFAHSNSSGHLRISVQKSARTVARFH